MGAGAESPQPQEPLPTLEGAEHVRRSAVSLALRASGSEATMSQQWIDGRLVEAPCAPIGASGRVGRAVWLYKHGVRVANHRGLAMRTVERLAEELVNPEAEV